MFNTFTFNSKTFGAGPKKIFVVVRRAGNAIPLLQNNRAAIDQQKSTTVTIEQSNKVTILKQKDA